MFVVESIFGQVLRLNAIFKCYFFFVFTIYHFNGEKNCINTVNKDEYVMKQERIH